MDPFGTTRSRVRRSHALIAPDSFVTSDLPGWQATRGVILISPAMGARFTQYLAMMDPGATAGQTPPGVERVLYVLEGEATLALPDLPERVVCPGGFAYWPPGAVGTLRALTACRLNVFEKRYVPRPGLAAPGRSPATIARSRAARSWAIPARSSRSCCRPTRDSISR